MTSLRIQPSIGGHMHHQVRKLITTLSFTLIAGAVPQAQAQAPKTPLAFKPDAPERYVVVPGDTLWSIAERFTDSPWRWPELWNLNKDQIANPHRIHPGNVIVLDRSRRQLVLDTTTIKLSPRVRAESTARTAIPSIPASAIEPFLTRPLVVEADGLDRAPTIVATEESRVVLEAGNRAFVKGIGDAREPNWLVYRRGKELVDPDNNATLGFEAVYLGSARLVRAGEPAVVQLTTVTQEVGVGDKLVAAGKPEVIQYVPRSPSAPIKGVVISVYGSGRTAEAGSQSIVTLNRGKANGVEVGHVLALHRPGTTVADIARRKDTPGATLTLPDERYGLAFVFRVFDRVAYAMVMRVTLPVNRLDVVQNP